MKNGSKTDFYNWIDDIKKAYWQKDELKEKLKFYESRLVGYNAVTYDHIGSGTSKNNVESNLLYVIDKIEKVKKDIEYCRCVIRKYSEFKVFLSSQQADILTLLVQTKRSKVEIAQLVILSRSRVYQLINEIISLFDFWNNV